MTHNAGPAYTSPQRHWPSTQRPGFHSVLQTIYLSFATNANNVQTKMNLEDCIDDERQLETTVPQKQFCGIWFYNKIVSCYSDQQ